MEALLVITVLIVSGAALVAIALFYYPESSRTATRPDEGPDVAPWDRGDRAA